MDLFVRLKRSANPPVLIGLALAIVAAGTIATHRAGEAEPSDSKAPRAGSPRQGDAAGAPRGRADPSQNAYDGGQGFMVPYRPACPEGSERRGAQPPEGFEEWCARVGRDAGLKHGWYSEWYPNGRPAQAGAYEDGLQVGIWTRWYPNGRKRVQAQFERGLQHGKLISWSEDGRQLGEKLFEQGSAVRVQR